MVATRLTPLKIDEIMAYLQNRLVVCKEVAAKRKACVVMHKLESLLRILSGCFQKYGNQILHGYLDYTILCKVHALSWLRLSLCDFARALTYTL